MVLVMSLWYLFCSQSRTNSFGTPIYMIPAVSLMIDVFLNQVLKLALDIPDSISTRQLSQSRFVSIVEYYTIFKFNETSKNLLTLLIICGQKYSSPSYRALGS